MPKVKKQANHREQDMNLEFYLVKYPEQVLGFFFRGTTPEVLGRLFLEPKG